MSVTRITEKCPNGQLLNLCGICGNTNIPVAVLGGSSFSHAEGQIMKTMAYCTNLILKAIEKVGKPDDE